MRLGVLEELQDVIAVDDTSLAGEVVGSTHDDCCFLGSVWRSDEIGLEAGVEELGYHNEDEVGGREGGRGSF